MMKSKHSQQVNRREFLARSGQAGIAAAAAMAGGLPLAGQAAARKKRDIEYPAGKAEHCIFIWLGGGASHLDTWDPKRVGDPAEKDRKKGAGSAYPAIDTAIPGVQVCEHLPQCAGILDRFTILRTVNHDVIDEHAAATNRLHTGRPPSGTIVYPSIGSIVSNQRGPVTEGVPAYIVMGYPSATRGPGFLGAKDGYVYLIDTESGPAGLQRPPDVTTFRQANRESLLGALRTGYLDRVGEDRRIADYDAALEQSFRLSSGDFMSAFQLDNESSGLRQAYGDEFGQRCLLARRLVQTGARFIEVSFNLNFINGTGWDTHNAGQKNQHILIQQLDQALATLVLDLEKHKLLEKTLVVVATEFGRPPEFDGGGGRGHWSKAFSVVMAGGGLKSGVAVGETDELGRRPVSDPISVPDLHATLHCALGIHPERNLYDGDRPVPITDRGMPVRRLFG